MDAPAMLQRKHVPEDVGLRNAGEDEGAAGGQEQLHREEKPHKPVLKKVKEKVKKIKSTLAGGSGNGHGDEQRRQGGNGDAGGSASSEEAEEDAAEREAAMEKGGYMEDVEDKPVAEETDPEVHGAPMYESVRAPPVPVQDLAAKFDPARAPAPAREAEGGDAHASGVRLGDGLGGPVVEDPAAPRSKTPAAREGEDIGTTPVVQQFESMSLSDDDPAHVGAAKGGASRPEEWKDEAADKVQGASGGGASYTDRLRSAAAGTTEYGRKLASTVYEKVAGGGTGTGGAAGKREDESAEAVPVSDAGAAAEEWKDAPAPMATDATDRPAAGAGYTDKIKSAAAGTTGYGKQLASTVYEKVAGVAPSLRPQAGEAKPEEARDRELPVSGAGGEELKDASAADARDSEMPVAGAGGEEWKDAPAADVRDREMPVDGAGSEELKGSPEAMDAAAADTASGAGYTDKIRSAAAGTTGYGKQLASTVYEKVAGVGTAVVGKVQQATQSAGTAAPGAGAQQDAGAGGQGKGVTGYIAEKLRPGDEDRALSGAISGAVQRRKEDVGGTVGQRVPAPGQVVAKAREAVTSLTGGNRVSETVQPSAATGEEVKEGYAAEAPVIHGEEIGDKKMNTNTM